MSGTISRQAKLGANLSIGKNVIIEDDVVIGNDCIIGHNVVIRKGVKIGSEVRIGDNTVLGKAPMISPRSIFKEKKILEPLVIDDRCQIGTNVIIYLQTRIGKMNLIADMATIREDVTIGELNIIGRNAAIENFVTIGDRCKLETNCYITAYSKIGNYCFIAPSVSTSNDNFIGRDNERFEHFKGVVIENGARVGVNATILPGRTIKEDGVVAAGSVVTRDVEKEEIWLGNPARKFRKVPEKQLLKNNLDKSKES